MGVHGFVLTVPTVPTKRVMCMNMLNQSTSNTLDINVPVVTKFLKPKHILVDTEVNAIPDMM